MATVRARIIKLVLERLGAIAGVGGVFDIQGPAEATIGTVLKGGQHAIEVLFDDNDVDEGVGASFDLVDCRMNVGILLHIGGAPATGQSWSELGADLDARLYSIHGLSDELGGWNGNAIKTDSIIEGGSVFVHPDRNTNCIAHMFAVHFRYQRNDPTLPAGGA